MNQKKIMWGGVAVIAVAVIAVAIYSPYPPKGDLSGAVGVAEHSRTAQVTDADVVLQDAEIQELLQSDFFYKLATDKEFRQIAVDQLARLDIADGRTAQFTNPASLAEMDNFLTLTVDNPELKMALAEGRMDIVNRILTAEGKVHFIDIANRVYMAQGRNAEINAKSYAEMKMFLGRVFADAEMKAALAAGRMDVVNRILVADGRVEMQDAANRVLLAENRNSMSGRAFNLAEMRVFLDLARTNLELRSALTEGRMDIVHRVLMTDGRTNLADVANRVYISLGRGPAIEATALDDMRSFVDLAAGNSDLRTAFAEGRIEMVNKILVSDGRTALTDAAGRVFMADGRGAQANSPVSLGDMKAFLDLSRTNVELKAAMAEGRMDIVHKMLIADGKTNLTDSANRIFLSLGRSPELNAVALEDMRSFVDLAAGNGDLKVALADGRMDMVNKVLVADGKMALNDAAGRVFLAANRTAIDGRSLNLADMRVFLDLARTNVELRTALADGRMDIVNKVLVAEGRTYVADAANRVYLGLGRNPQLNTVAIDDMRAYIDAVGASADLKAAMADGRLDLAQRVLATEGKTALSDAAGRVFMASNASGLVARDYAMGDLRAVAAFAGENAEFGQAMQDGRIEMAARVAIAAGKTDVSLRSLQTTSFVVGDSRSFLADLGRLVAVADTPSFKQAADNPGWGRMLATTDAATWKQAVEAAGDGRQHARN